jgi:hypothetical protein
MKSGFGFVLLFIHVLVLSTGAQEAASHLQWPTAGIFAAWLFAGLAGLFPILRSLVLFAILATLMAWWQAALLTFPLAFLMYGLSIQGKKLLETRPTT